MIHRQHQTKCFVVQCSFEGFAISKIFNRDIQWLINTFNIKFNVLRLDFPIIKCDIKSKLIYIFCTDVIYKMLVLIMYTLSMLPGDNAILMYFFNNNTIINIYIAHYSHVVVVICHDHVRCQIIPSS